MFRLCIKAPDDPHMELEMGMAVHSAIQTPYLERAISTLESKRREWHPISSYKAKQPLLAEDERQACFISLLEQGYWDNLMQLSHRGCEKSYRHFLEEVADWLDDYLIELDFLGDHSALIFEILQAIHDKMATYDPNVGVASWLTAIVDYKLANAFNSPSSFFEKIEGFLGSINHLYHKELRS